MWRQKKYRFTLSAILNKVTFNFAFAFKTDCFMIGREFRCKSLVGCSMQFPRLTKKTGKFRPSSFYQKTAAKVWNCTKDGFEEIEQEFPFGTFRPEKQEYLFRCSAPPAKFPLKRPKSRLPFTFQPYFSEPFWGDPDSSASPHQKVKSLRYF